MPWKQWINKPFVKKGWLSLLLVVGIVGYLHGIYSDVDAAGERLPVVVVKHPIAMNHVFVREDVSVVMVPKRYRNPSAMADISLVVGHVALVNMAEGDHVATSSISVGSSRLSSSIPKNKRLVAIAIDPSAMLPVKMGDWVDLIVTSIVTQMGEKKVESLPLLERIPVVDVEPSNGSVSRSVIYGWMSPDQALRLMTAEKQGVVTAIVRPVDDGEE